MRCGPDIHLRKQRAQEQERQRKVRGRRERGRDQSKARRDMREDHGVDEADASGEVRCDELREGSAKTSPEKELRCRGERQIEVPRKPQGEQRIDDEPAAEGID